MGKVCRKCEVEQPLEAFSRRTKSKDGRQSYCKSCRKVVDAHSYKSRPERRAAIREVSRVVVEFNYRLVNRYKGFFGCCVCGEGCYQALDLHHIDPSEKDLCVARLIKYSTERLRTEIRKCIVLCANCHRKHHAGILDLPR